MVKKIITRIKYPVLIMGIVLCMLVIAQVVLGSNIDSSDRYAWGTNVGWINFAPQCTGCEGVTVYADHLEGYAWGENIGWIRMGTHTGGGSHTYVNDAADDYGVNVDGSGNLSGYAWSKNVGWINFDPNNGGVTVDLTTGEFDGYAWGENIGWLHFKHTTAPLYNVAANLADLTVTKSVTPANAKPGQAVSGQPITYTLIFSNVGGGLAFGVVITDTIPVNVTNTSVISSSGVTITQRAGTRYVWDVAELAGGESGVITITGTLSDSLSTGAFTNTAIITTTAIDSDRGNNSSSARVTVGEPHYIYLPMVLKNN